MRHKSVRKAVAGFESPRIDTVEALVSAVSEIFGKPIYLESLDEANWGSLTAFLAESDDAVTIYYRLQDTPQYRLQCICHELGHLVMGSSCALPFDVHVAEQVDIPVGSQRLQARDLRDTDAEKEAEEFSFHVIRHLRSQMRHRTRLGEAFG